MLTWKWKKKKEQFPLKKKSNHVTSVCFFPTPPSTINKDRWIMDNCNLSQYAHRKKNSWNVSIVREFFIFSIVMWKFVESGEKRELPFDYCHYCRNPFDPHSNANCFKSNFTLRSRHSLPYLPSLGTLSSSSSSLSSHCRFFTLWVQHHDIEKENVNRNVEEMKRIKWVEAEEKEVVMLALIFPFFTTPTPLPNLTLLFSFICWRRTIVTEKKIFIQARVQQQYGRNNKNIIISHDMSVECGRIRRKEKKYFYDYLSEYIAKTIWSHIHDSINMFCLSLSLYQHGLLHIGTLWRTITLWECVKNATSAASGGIFTALLLLLEDHFT